MKWIHDARLSWMGTAMKIKHILVPIDFSEANEAANLYASTLADATGAEITYLHVSFADVVYGSYSYINVEDDEKRDMELLRKFEPTNSGVKADYAVKMGPPADTIVEFARDHVVDLIVLGTHGRTGLSRVLMGSVAEAVVRKADCPVLAVKSNTVTVENSDDAQEAANS
ncbi:MAG: universal stress protein [Pirellulaceae bacterium]